MISSLGPSYPTTKFLTKGDNNDDDDTALYPAGQRYLDRQDIIGVTRGYIPHVGYIRILLSDYLWVKIGLGITVGLAFALH